MKQVSSVTGKRKCICHQQNQTILTESASVYTGFRCSGCVIWNFLALFSNPKVAVMGQRSGEALSLLYP